MNLSFSTILFCLAAPYVVPAAATDHPNDCSRDGSCVSFDVPSDTDEPASEGVEDGPPAAANETGRPKRSPQDGTGFCVLPPFPERGSYDVIGRPEATPGQAFDVVRLNITCRPGFRVVGKSIVFCINGLWSAEIPQCVRSCKLDKHPSVNYNCVLSGSKYGEAYRECNDYEPVGTVVKPECNAPHYYNTGVLSRMHCIGSQWDYVAVCTPECGKITSAGKQLIIGGKEADRGEFPWHAGIYRKTETSYQQICGGSLVSTTIVLSAAHCFWDGFKKKLQPESKYAVAVGKLHRSWDDPNDVDAQKSDVRNIRVPFRFKGAATRFQDDIAVVVLATPIVYQTYVLPICVDFDSLFERRQLQNGNTGKVAGWGLSTPNGPASDALRVADMPYIPILKCIEEAPASFEAYITSDKVCAGYLTNGTAVCKGDSGGGLVFADVERGTRRYYLRGIVSTAPSNEDACNAFAVTSYTQISAHRSFIEENTVLFGDHAPNNAEEEQAPNPITLDLMSVPAVQADTTNVCVVPTHPKNGVYLFAGTPNAYNIQLNTVCNSGYLPEDNATIFCSYGKWSKDIPVCLRSCKFGKIGHPTVYYSCQDGETFRVCRGEEPSGAIIHVRCSKSREGLPPMNCVDGSWDSFPMCIPECGRLTKTEGLFPWYAHVYKKEGETHERVCGGSLISPKVIISAAHCFWDEKENKQLPASDFAVAVGKQHPKWEDSRDADSRQTSDVSAVTIHNLFRGTQTGFVNDIAVITLSKDVAYNDNVGPVCIDRYLVIEGRHLREGQTGRAAMWGPPTSDGNDSFRIVDMPYVKRRECTQKSPATFANYLTYDKFCAGKQDGADLCRGDDGGGIVFTESDRGSDRYFLRGIMSKAPSTNDNACNAHPYLTFVRVSSHYGLINNTKTRRVKEKTGVSSTINMQN